MLGMTDMGQFARKINIDIRINVELYNETIYADFAGYLSKLLIKSMSKRRLCKCLRSMGSHVRIVPGAPVT